MHIGILGGSFNPVHVGHVRLALEVLEASHAALPPLSAVHLIPSAQPPHKPAADMLPFALRLAMLKAAVQDMPGLMVNDLEGQRRGPSYTWDTLTAYHTLYPAARLLFVVGGEDYGALSQWHRGLELPQLTHIGMVPRAGADDAAFAEETSRHWPEARIVRQADSLYADLPGGARLYYLPLPRLDISASLIRERWLKGGNVRYLLPDPVLTVLEEHRDTVRQCWQNNPLAP